MNWQSASERVQRGAMLSPWLLALGTFKAEAGKMPHNAR